MEVEVQKRNTDCVYFLASPLTCKKGSECEYRHSENARLNPRDCWYWLNSNCLNPTCAFRHPPLEGITETASESVCIPPYAAVPTSKSNVPCYFYFNAYCIKGDQCPFLHDTMPLQKFPKTTSGAITHALEIKTSTESDTGPALVEFAVNASGDNWEMIKHYHSKEVLQQPVPSSALQEPSPSVQSSVPECEEPAIKSSEMPDCPAEYTNGSPHLSPGQDSEELVKERVEQDDWWESSPGFDVLVDDGSEKIAYEDDAEYLLAQERESGMTHNHLLQYDFEVPAGYDPAGYPDAGYLYDHGVYDSYDPLDTKYIPEHFQRVSERSRSRERNSEPDSHRRRKPPRRRHEMNGRDSADLRDRLRKRRRTDVSEGSRDSRRHHSSRTRGSVHERTGRWGMGPSPHSRHAPEVGQSMILSSLSETQPVLKDFYQQTWVGYPQSSRLARSRLKERESRRKHKKPMPTLSSEISLVIESSESKTAGAAFTGPKTLAQIKEEKRRAKENGSNSNAHVPRHERPGGHAPQHERRPSSIDFEGPKPLNELLKDKRRPVPLSGSANGSADMASKQEHLELSSSWVEKRSIHPGEDSEHYHETVKECDNEFESDFVGEEDDDDDDDALRRKLAHILSQ